MRERYAAELTCAAGLNPIAIVTELRARHAAGDRAAGINVRKGLVGNILDEQVVQPLLVATSAISLASETAALILRIDGASHADGAWIGRQQSNRSYDDPDVQLTLQQTTRRPGRPPNACKS